MRIARFFSLPGRVLRAGARCGCWLALIGLGSMRAAPPEWLFADARMESLPASLGRRGGEAEVLREETIVSIGPKGEWTETLRYAARVRATGGEDAARMRFGYVDKSDRIINAEAWVVRAGKAVKTYPRKVWLDAAAMNQTTLYITDIRWLGHGFIGERDAVVGDVYGAEVSVGRGHNAGQMQISFGDKRPLRRGRLEFRVPAGWEPDLFWLQGEGPAPVVSADRTVWVWELTGVPAVKSEVWAPPQAGLYVASVMVRPPSGLRGVYPEMRSWGDYARWAEGVHRPQCDTGPALAELAAKLTAGLTDPWAKLEVLAKYAQKQTYIQQYDNTGLGFGYRPRLASVVLATGYGDCKDKANLLRALLREAGLVSYFAVVRVSPGYDVRPQWPGQQFNHAIVAIELPAGLDHPAVVKHPVFGRLLFFDPTNPWVAPGQLPWYEHGGYALICDARETALTTLPVFPAEQTWSSEAQVDLLLREQGIVQGHLVEKVVGEPAAQARRRAGEAAPAKQRQFWTDRLARTLSGVKVANTRGQEVSGAGYQTEVDFAARGFGQWAQDKLLVLRLDVLTRDTVPVFTNKARLYPVLVKPVHDGLVVRFGLPSTLSIPELPVAQSVRSEFGQYEGAYNVADGWLVFRRTLTLHYATVQPEKYRALQAFLLEVAKAEATSVVLVSTLAASSPAKTPAAHPAAP